MRLVFGFLGLGLSSSESGECSRTGLLVTKVGAVGLRKGMKASNIFAGLRPLPAEREDDCGSENSSIVFSSEALA